MFFLSLLIAFAVAYCAGTLVEYIMHRFVLHSNIRSGVMLWITQRHWNHHISNEADHIWGDFRDSLPVTLAFCWLGFLHSWPIGLAFLAGTLFYTFILAISHKWSHEHPNWLVTLGIPVHAAHHDGKANVNYGVTTMFWDWVFRTYEPSSPATRTASPIC